MSRAQTLTGWLPAWAAERFLRFRAVHQLESLPRVSGCFVVGLTGGFIGGGVVASGCVDPSRVCCGGHLGCSLLVVDGGARFLQHVVRSVAFVVKAALFSFVLFCFSVSCLVY